MNNDQIAPEEVVEEAAEATEAAPEMPAEETGEEAA